ncbi:MAG: hypothetical protein OEZ58_00685 [Gammaproteobacteria bacterium]|nr:hypothetical protein [Gammaproteobacteria bacterium]MDH5727490.1 hypothetical protein [Gammaproteobacteria bacterium]
MSHFRLIMLIFLLGGGLLMSGAAYTAVDRASEVIFRSALFDFYRGDYLQGLARMETIAEADKTAEPKYKLFESILLGNFNLDIEAFKGFAEVRRLNPVKTLADQALFGQILFFYERKEFDKFEHALRFKPSDLSPDKLDRLNFMILDALVRAGDWKTSASLLKKINKKSKWYHYAQFNYGVGRMLNGQADGWQSLDQVSRYRGKDTTLAALADKANLGLGYHFLGQNNFQKSLKFFQQVRLHGGFSSKAMLGMGWAYSNANQHRQALVAWTSLSKRNIASHAVQEALVAMPFTLNKMGASRQALSEYSLAQKRFSDYETFLSRFALTIKQQGLDRVIPSWYLLADPKLASAETFENEYLGFVKENLLINEKLQQSIRIYQDLLYMEQVLDRLETLYDTALHAQSQLGLLRVKPNIKASSQQLDKIGAAIMRAEKNVQQINRSKRFMNFANETEAQVMADVRKLLQQVRQVPNREAQRRYLLTLKSIYGQVVWRLASQFEARSQKYSDELNRLESQLNQMNGQAIRLTRHDGKQVDVSETLISEKIYHARTLLDKALIHYRAEIRNELKLDLQKHQEQVAYYLSQTKYAIANIYDTATNQ